MRSRDRKMKTVKCIVVTAAESMACDGIAVASLPKAQGAFGVARESGERRRLKAS
jgi:hypothetical protein